MERLVKGDVVAVKFYYSDLSNYKKRPALVLLSLKGEDLILSEITTKVRDYPGDIKLLEENFDKGRLRHKSIIRLTRIFTMNRRLIDYKIGNLKSGKVEEVIDELCNLFKYN